MTTKRIKEIQKTTGFPDNVPIQQALLQVWNEVAQESNRLEKLVIPKIADLTKEIKKASQTGILITINITELGSAHLNASLDKKFIDLDVLQDILDNNFSV